MTTSFEMTRAHTRRTRDWSGTSEEFGAIEVFSPKDLGPKDGTGAKVQGTVIPTALLTGFSLFGGDPRLTGAQLWVADEKVRLRRNPWAVSRERRALRLTNEGVDYRCTAVSRKKYAFTRPGLAVTVTESGFGRKRRRLTVVIDGPAEPVDISLAVLFSRVNRSQLTLGGAFRAGFSTIFNLLADNAARS
ncbi:hypothetical protein [Streptomyces sp. 2P-4]|uniref:hypothetical protein n=1 Tax=Streptomyces sp. 2P-4 TaxID=2931974 RepID=UPI00254145C8|nr:hypothetical protein [Streptomyces sp. 2P-4]